MKVEQLDKLLPGTTLYLPTPTDVLVLIFAGRVFGSDYFSCSSILDSNGAMITKRPTYYHPLDLLPATLSRQKAWLSVRMQLEERNQWINTQLSTKRKP